MANNGQVELVEKYKYFLLLFLLLLHTFQNKSGSASSAEFALSKYCLLVIMTSAVTDFIFPDILLSRNAKSEGEVWMFWDTEGCILQASYHQTFQNVPKPMTLLPSFFSHRHPQIQVQQRFADRYYQVENFESPLLNFLL